MKLYKYYIAAFAVILLDQIIKMLVHFNMTPGLLGEIHIFGTWFKLHYTLNPGMAFGLKLGSDYGKFVLSIFRIIAVTGIAYYIAQLVKKEVNTGFVWCMALVLGGAIGNVLDSTFYGVLPFIKNAPYDAVTPWFHGQVIDMFYFDIWEGVLPAWIPLWGGDYASFWPIFNFADASIFVGVMIILFNQKNFLEEPVETTKVVTENTESEIVSAS